MRKWIARAILVVFVVAFITFLILTWSWVDFLILLAIIAGTIGFITGGYWVLKNAFDIK